MKHMRSSNTFMGICYVCSLLLLSACSESSYDVEMLAYDHETDSFVYKVNTIETLTDLPTLSGRATTILGGVSIIFDYDSGESGEVRWDRVGTPVAFGAVKSGGVYYPEDFDSLAMVSIYYNIEQAMLYFESLGLDIETLGKLNTFYWADVLEISSSFENNQLRGADNAFYVSIDQNDRGFYILPFDQIDQIPLSMNPGVLTHEYTHSVFQALVYDKIPEGEASLDFAPYSYLFGLNEGLADVFAVALTGDPDFIRPSMSHIWVTRDASQPIVYTPSFEYAIDGNFPETFDPYEIGAFVSAALFEMGRRIDGLPANQTGISSEEARFLIAQAAFDALFNLGEQGVELFELPDFFNLFIEQIAPMEPAYLGHACDVLSERYAMYYAEIEGCP